MEGVLEGAVQYGHTSEDLGLGMQFVWFWLHALSRRDAFLRRYVQDFCGGVHTQNWGIRYDDDDADALILFIN